ncbi:Hypothetical predicted protein [Pelobates cultripes]|uniref:Uncharacterized protein n=1 Tax=Pelobates cultripes TaxID=61616 RepID=A0AAD1T1R0_PELCU|nr:Hypothetical predicted protein [Pelobates cultripes]
MAGAMCARGEEETELTPHHGIPPPRPGNREGQKNHHLSPQPHGQNISDTKDPNKRDLPPNELPSHSPATQLAPPTSEQRHNQAADAGPPAGSDINPWTINRGRLYNERPMPGRHRRGPYRTTRMEYIRKPALTDVRSLPYKSSRAGFKYGTPSVYVGSGPP